MAAVAAGRLRHRVRLQDKQQTQNPTTGELSEAWVDVAEVWANVVPMSGREFMAASAEQSEVRGRIEIRYRNDVFPHMRIVHRGMVYTIHAVLPDPDSGLEHLNLMVGEGVRLNY